MPGWPATATNPLVGRRAPREEPAADRAASSGAEADARAARRVRAGDTEAFAEIVERHQDRIFALCAARVPAQDAAEVAQDAFIRAFQGIGSWRGSAPLGHWLASIATRACHDYWRARGRRPETPLSALPQEGRDWLEAAQEGVHAGQRALEGFEAAQVVDWALAQLGATDRMVLTLTVLEERSTAEAAELLGMTRTTVKVRALRARRKLHKIISAELGSKE